MKTILKRLMHKSRKCEKLNFFPYQLGCEMERKYQAIILCISNALIDNMALVKQYKPKLTWILPGFGKKCTINIEQNGETLYPFEVNFNDIKIVAYKYDAFEPLNTYKSLTLGLPEGYNIIVLFIPHRTITLSQRGSAMSAEEYGTQVVLDAMEVYNFLSDLIVKHKFPVRLKE
jgi:hypothetical protein